MVGVYWNSFVPRIVFAVSDLISEFLSSMTVWIK